MITLSEVLPGNNWSGTSDVLEDGGYVTKKNLDSSMDFAEHQRIVVEAKGLLQGAIGTANAAAKAMFEELQKAYNEATPGKVLVIAKGIHQVGSDAHIQVRLVDEAQKNQANAGTTFHLNVDDVALAGPGLERRSQWKGIQFKGWVGPTAYWWPMPARTISKDRRRNSISAVGLAAHVQQLKEEAEAAARQQAAKERNAKWQSVSEKFKTANTDIVYKMGPNGYKSLRDNGTLEVALTGKGKDGKKASLIWDGNTITRKNL
jgi:hypothetical protein